MTRFRVSTSPMGKFRDTSKRTFIAEFADGYIAGEYCKAMRDDKRYAKCDIIMEEVPDAVVDTAPGKVVMAIYVTGEYYELDD